MVRKVALLLAICWFFYLFDPSFAHDSCNAIVYKHPLSWTKIVEQVFLLICTFTFPWANTCVYNVLSLKCFTTNTAKLLIRLNSHTHISFSFYSFICILKVNRLIQWLLNLDIFFFKENYSIRLCKSAAVQAMSCKHPEKLSLVKKLFG